MRRTWWQRLNDWSLGWRPIHYRTPTGDWWAWRGRYYRVNVAQRAEGDDE